LGPSPEERAIVPSDIEAKQQWVERVLGYRFPSGPNGAAGNATPGRRNEAGVRLAQGLLVWNGTRSRVAEQVKALQQAILAQSSGEADFGDIKAGIGNLDDILESLDDSLSDKLSELRGTTNPALKEAGSKEAAAIVARFEKFVAEDALINEIDDNGFVATDIKAKITAALAAVRATI
jgi:hypothetical protein